MGINLILNLNKECISNCKFIDKNEKENEYDVLNDINKNKEINKDKEKFDKDKFKFKYFILNDKLEEELEALLKESVEKTKVNLNKNNVFEREDIQKENKDIIIKIKKQLSNYKSSMENYLMKRATFLKKVGYLVRFSHEIAIYLFQYLLIRFKKENGIHSIEEETVRLYFSSWIKELFNENYFKKISENENIYSQIKDKIEEEINSKNEIEFLKNIFPDIIKLYFHCFLADIKVNIVYAKENSKFDPENMIDILLTGLEDDKNILFTFLPGLYCNGQYFQNSYIYVTTYPMDDPNKFPFEKPAFKTMESDITIETVNLMKSTKFNYNLKDESQNGLYQVEFALAPDINWDKPNNYYFYLIDSDGKKYIFDNKLAYIPEGIYKILKIVLNGKKIEKQFEEIKIQKAKKNIH